MNRSPHPIRWSGWIRRVIKRAVAERERAFEAELKKQQGAARTSYADTT